MKKSKALTLAILATMCTLVSLFSQYPVWALFFAMPAVLFWSIWYFKHQRDRRIVRRAAARWTPSQPAPTVQITQTVTSQRRNNNGLFVPPPLQ